MVNVGVKKTIIGRSLWALVCICMLFHTIGAATASDAPRAVDSADASGSTWASNIDGSGSVAGYFSWPLASDNSMISRVVVSDSDADGDGIADSLDNCPNYWNPEQFDADEDGIGNVCDECTDQDGDGYGDPGFPTNTCLEDNCPGFANPDQSDTNGDGIGDLCEGLECGDVNGSGQVDIGDCFRAHMYAWRGGPSPASLEVANTGGCSGVNLYDLVYTYCFEVSYYNCDGPDICSPLPVGAVQLEPGDGLYATDTIVTGQPVVFFLRLIGGVSRSVDGLANGFRVYSHTGASWGEAIITELFDLNAYAAWGGFDFSTVMRRGITGSGADTVALGCIDYWGMAGGLLPGFDSVTHAIEIGPIPHEFSGGEICIDSCWYPPCGDWMWAQGGVDGGPDGVPYTPSWDGPHCFTIYNCCLIRGDINDDGSGPDIADLIYLVSYMFQLGPSLPCPTAADINGDESLEPDISDLIHLVMFMFQDGPAVVPCP